MKTEIDPKNMQSDHTCEPCPGCTICLSFEAMSVVAKKRAKRTGFSAIAPPMTEKRDGDPVALRQSPRKNRTQPAISAVDVAESLLP